MSPQVDVAGLRHPRRRLAGRDHQRRPSPTTKGAVTKRESTALIDAAAGERRHPGRRRRCELAGVAQQQSEAFGSLFLSMGVAILLVYLVMVLVFGSLVDPLVILFSLPLATIGAFPALLITGQPIGISALIGFLMLIGIVVTNAIVLLDLVEQLRHKGCSTYDALIQGGRTRVRPILMTAVATILALMPLALGFSEGSVIAAELGDGGHRRPVQLHRPDARHRARGLLARGRRQAWRGAPVRWRLTGRAVPTTGEAAGAA